MNRNVVKALPASINVSRVCSPIEMHLIIGGAALYGIEELLRIFNDEKTTLLLLYYKV